MSIDPHDAMSVFGTKAALFNGIASALYEPFGNIRAKLTTEARDLVPKTFQGITMNNGYIEGTMEDVTALRLQLLSKLVKSWPDSTAALNQDENAEENAQNKPKKTDEMTTKLLSPRIAANLGGNTAPAAGDKPTGKVQKDSSKKVDQVVAHGESSASTSVSPRRYFIDEYLFLFEQIVCKGTYLLEIQKGFNCVIEVINPHQVPSITNHYVELRCTPHNDEALDLYMKYLEKLRRENATIVIPLPSCFDAKEANDLENLAQKVHMDAQASTRPNQGFNMNIKSTSHVDLANRVLVHHCPNLWAERADFKIRRLIKGMVYKSRKGFENFQFDNKRMGFFSYPNQQTSTNANCIVVVCSNSMVNVPADIYVNSIAVDLELSGGLAKALSDAAGYELQSELKKVKNELLLSGKSARMFPTYSRLQNAAKSGDIVCTRGYKLPCDYVLHAVSPVGTEFSAGSKFSSCLTEIYSNVLRTAGKLYPESVHSIAIPLLSGRIMRRPYQLQDCVKGLTDAMELAAAQQVLSRFAKVYLVNSDEKATELLLSYMNERRFVSANRELQLVANGSNPFNMGNTKVHSALAADKLYDCELRQSFAVVNPPDAAWSVNNPPKSSISLSNSATSSNTGPNQLSHVASPRSASSRDHNLPNSVPSTSSTSYPSNSSAASHNSCARAIGGLSCVPFGSVGTSLVLSCTHYVCVKCYKHEYYKSNIVCKLCSTSTNAPTIDDLQKPVIKFHDSNIGLGVNPIPSEFYRVDISVANKGLWVTHFPATEDGRRKALELDTNLRTDIFKFFQKDVFTREYCWSGCTSFYR